MTDVSVLQVGREALLMAAKLAGPILLTALAIGLAISLLQSVTQIQEVTLTFVPKFIGVGIVLMVAGGWMMGELVSFTVGLFELLPTLLGR